MKRKTQHSCLLKWLFCSMPVIILFVGCKELSETDKIKEAAKATIEESYEALLKGDYETFLSHRAGSENLPDDYREQLLTSYRQYIWQQKEEHGGINDFQINDVRIDSLQNLAQVYVQLNYADSLQEEILIPVVKSGEEWKMK